MNFPNSPSVGETYNAPTGMIYRYDGEKWTTLGSSQASTGVFQGDNISSLTNDALYITSASLPLNVSDLFNDSNYVSSGSNISQFTNDESYIKQGEGNALLNNTAGYLSAGAGLSNFVNDTNYLVNPMQSVSQPLEIGFAIDFHAAGQGGLDYSARMFCDASRSNALYIANNTSSAYSGYAIVGANTFGIKRQNGYMEFNTDAGAVGCNYFGSDIEFKQNIEITSYDALEVIKQVNFVDFDYKEEYGSHHINCGVIAQELEAIDPQFVNEMSDGKLMVNDTTLLPVTMKAVKELLEEVESLKARIAVLENN